MNNLLINIQYFIKKMKLSLLIFYVLFLILWSVFFYNDSFFNNLIRASKLTLFLFMPGIFFTYALYENKDPLVIILMGVCAGILLNSLLYFFLGLLNMGLNISIYLSPILLILISLFILIFTVSKQE